jgi:hypothetical protein
MTLPTMILLAWMNLFSLLNNSLVQINPVLSYSELAILIDANEFIDVSI